MVGWPRISAIPPGVWDIPSWLVHFLASPDPGSPPGGSRLADRSREPGQGVDGPRARLTSAEFSTLFQSNHRALWCIAAAITRDSVGAHDVVQEAAVIALGKLHEFDPSTSFTAWCGQIVRYSALNERRRGGRSRAISTDPAIMAETSPAAHSPEDVSMFSGALAAALETLEETARACLLMRTVMDMTYKQIAEALGVPEGTAMSHVHRSRQALRARLESAAGKEVAP